MRLSVTVPAEDVRFLDHFAREHHLGSRVAALRYAIHQLRFLELAGAYEEAWQEWADSDDHLVWQESSADGLTQPDPLV